MFRTKRIAVCVLWTVVIGAANVAVGADSTKPEVPIFGVKVQRGKQGTLEQLRAFDTLVRSELAKQTSPVDLRCNGCDALNLKEFERLAREKLDALTYTFPKDKDESAALFVNAWIATQPLTPPRALTLTFKSDPEPIPTCNALPQPCYNNTPCKYIAYPASNKCSEIAYPGSCRSCLP